MPNRLQAARHARRWTVQQLIFELARVAASHEETTPSRASLKRQISRWENDHEGPDKHYQGLLREVYGLDDAELGFDHADPSGECRTAEQELLDAFARAGHVDADAVRRMRDELENLRRMDRRLGAQPLLEHTRVEVTTLSEWLRHCLTPTRRPEIARILADAAALAGWQALDLGATAQAWNHFELAKAAACEAKDIALLAWAGGEQAYVLMDLGRGVEAHELLQYHRRQLQRRVPQLLRCWLAAAEAETAASQPNDLTCRRALEHADALLTSAADPDATPYVTLDAVHLARWRGHVLARLGDDKAINDLTLAAASMDAEFTRARAGLHIDLAVAYTKIGELDERRRHATIATELARQAGSVRQQRRLRALAG